jgi:hypothetical protein
MSSEISTIQAYAFLREGIVLMPTSRNAVVPKATSTHSSESSINRSRLFSPSPSGGQSLDGATNAKMSARFSHDFSKVKIHADTSAAETAEAIGAQALTLGNDITFGEGAYSPGSESSERLLAHELTHVVQQDRYGQGTGGLKSRWSDHSEQEAESAAEQVIAGNRVDVRSAPRAAISCFDPANNDVQNDFWNTKSTLGNKWGNVADSAINTVWDGIGAIPEVGSVLSTGVDLAKSGYSEGMSTLHGWEADLTGDTGERMRSKQYDEAASGFLGDAAVDATGMIPGYGTAQSLVAGTYDANRTYNLATGQDPTATPSSGDFQKGVAKTIWNGVNPPTPAATPDPNQAPDPNQPPPNMPADPFQGM